MKVWSICASISATITDIWTKFGTEHKYNTTNTLEWPNSHKLKSKMAAAAILNFEKNVNNFGLDKDILHQIIWEDAPRRRGDDHVTKSQNRKFIRVTSSNECLMHMCVDLSDYNRYLNQMCTEHKYCPINTPEWPNSHKQKIQDGGGRHLGFRKMSITPNWIELFAQKLVDRCITAMRRWNMANCRNRNFFAWRHYYDE